MGFNVGKVFKKAVKAVTKTAKSFVTVPTDALKAVAKGDLGGLADAAARAASAGTISLGDKGVLNANMTNQPKQASDAVAQSDDDSLLAYVSALRTRKARRNRASTDNTGGTYADGNKLSGSTPLGV